MSVFKYFLEQNKTKPSDNWENIQNPEHAEGICFKIKRHNFHKITSSDQKT